MLIGIGLLWVIQAFGQPIVRENVVFMPISQFSITQATWTVSFMLDLKMYDEFIKKIESVSIQARRRMPITPST